MSDQTNWLDELDARLDFFKLFDAVYNSYHLGKSKADASQFSDIVSRMKDKPGRVLFVDDDEAHCQRARSAGLNAMRYHRPRSIPERICALLPALMGGGSSPGNSKIEAGKAFRIKGKPPWQTYVPTGNVYLARCLLDGHGYRNGRADHRVVPHAEEPHHFDVCGD